MVERRGKKRDHERAELAMSWGWIEEELTRIAKVMYVMKQQK
jgi:hypothetical protein